eukprot:82419-Pelagomonas_calceolata.AAC.1
MPCKFGDAIWRVLWSESLSQTTTHSPTYKHNLIFPEGKQGGWSFCHAFRSSSRVVAAVVTRGQKRSLGLGRSAGVQLPLPPGASEAGGVTPEMMLRRQPIILGSPRARALSVDPPSHSPPLSTRSQAHSGGEEQLGGGEELTPLTPGTPGCGWRADSSCQLKGRHPGCVPFRSFIHQTQVHKGIGTPQWQLVRQRKGSSAQQPPFEKAHS